MAVIYAELHTYPNESWQADGFQAVRKLVCAWADRDALVIELGLGYGATYPYGLFTSPTVKDYLKPRVVKIDVEPFPAAVLPFAGFDPRRATYELAMLTVKYSTLSYRLVKRNNQTDKLIREELAPAAEFITLDHEQFFWAKGGGTKGVKFKRIEAPGKMITRYAYTITFYNVKGDGDNWTAFLSAASSYVNYCNSDPVVTFTKAFTFGPGQLQYMGTDLERAISFNTNPLWTIKQRFLVQPAGWQKLWNAKNEKFENVYKANGTDQKKLLKEASFASLWNF